MTFSDDIRKFAEKAKRGFDEVVRESLVDLSASIIIKTPVDEATLVNSWMASTAIPAEGVVAIGGPRMSDAEIEDRIVASIGGVYYFVNNQPYAGRIEFTGHSDKAPSGMVRISIENYQQFIDNRINQLN